ncbi:MAG: glutamate-cysteine ligase family protein [Phycisphaeraceae bacterium]
MSKPLHLFDAVGIELEYMIVQRDTLDVRPLCDRLLASVTGGAFTDAAFDDVTWSNELVLHVVEFKTSQPARSLTCWSDTFARHVQDATARLADMDAMLLPSAMHPWMDPHAQAQLWPHDSGEIYAAFHKLFNCRGHGWANLQSTHINLPFADDDEFGRLHAAIRLLLPILPALAASSPVMDGRVTGLLDNRLDVYRRNCARIPQCTGQVIPEPVFSIDAYHGQILQPMYAALRPFDPDGLLQEEYANARGAIARFGRGSIEIRVLDVQECPAMDVAFVALIVAVLKQLVAERWCDYRSQQRWGMAPLVSIFDRCVREGEAAVVDDADYLRCFGCEADAPMSAGALWRHLIARIETVDPEAIAAHAPALRTWREQGPLARRLLAALGEAPAPGRLRTVYRQLATCLSRNTTFVHHPVGETP